MNKQIIIRAIAAAVVILAVNINVRAQVGGALNRARNAVEQTVKENTPQQQQQQQQQQTQQQEQQQQPVQQQEQSQQQPQQQPQPQPQQQEQPQQQQPTAQTQSATAADVPDPKAPGKFKHNVAPDAAPKDFSKPGTPFMNIPADIEKVLLARANAQFKFRVDKIYFENENWETARETTYPNRITMRTRFAYCLTEQDGGWIRTIWILQQRSDLQGGWTDEYHFVAGNPLNYNPYPVNNYDPKWVTRDYKP